MKSSPIYNKLQHFLIEHACMNMSYINMCKLNKNREWRKELERERERGVGGDDVCDCSLGKLLDNKKHIF